MKLDDVKALLAQHDGYWETRKQEMLRYKSAYEMDFWQEGVNDPTQIRIQTNDGYGYIESFQASLFAKNPAVVVKPGIRGLGNPLISQAICNHYLLKSRNQIEAASRMALIYPNSFVKLCPNKSDDVYEKVIPVALPPWEVIVDRDAPRWSLQRYCAHIYWMPLPDAKERFGDLDYSSESRESFFDDAITSGNYTDRPGEQSPGDVSSRFQYIKVIEMYDFMEDKVQWWSPSVATRFLDEDTVPFRAYDDTPQAPIAPFYYNYLPDTPLVGYSSMKRIYDQLYEMNVIRSFQANAVRKASRQWLVKKGEIDAESMGQITSGIDGLFVEVDTEEPLDSIIRPVPLQQLSLEVTRYFQEVSKDKDKGSVTAPFMRGEATRATATEIAALAAYSSSEVGRLARERDGVIEYLAKTYLSVLSVFLAEEDEAQLVVLDGEAQVVGVDDIIGDFQVWASDTASTPMSEAVHQQRLLANVPVLQALGVPPQLILREMVRSLKLPEDFLVEAEQMMAQNVPGQSPQPGTPVTASDMAGEPSAAMMRRMMREGGEA